MQTLVADQSLPEKLRTVEGTVRIVDADGQILGEFVRKVPIPPELDIDLTYEEAMRIVNDPNTKWVPAAEVEARLRRLL